MKLMEASAAALVVLGGLSAAAFADGAVSYQPWPGTANTLVNFRCESSIIDNKVLIQPISIVYNLSDGNYYAGFEGGNLEVLQFQGPTGDSVDSGNGTMTQEFKYTLADPAYEVYVKFQHAKVGSSPYTPVEARVQVSSRSGDDSDPVKVVVNVVAKCALAQ